ncbi:hypothetical protein ACAW63_02635 [Pseudomonas sp. QE6]|uniref:hypothetical protein n=1 Tax=Pseudomonas sp. QE6 TaxID=3242491 RepID=UPI003528045C
MSFEIERSDSGTVVNLLGGHRFELPVITDGDLTSYPIQVFHNSLPIVGEAITQLKAIGDDRTLSSLGVEQKSDPVKAELVGRIASGAGQIRLFENTITNAENHLYALPSIEQGHTVAAIEDREIRDWWRSMKNQDRLQMLDQVQGDPAKHERLMIALLRAPAPLALLDHETKFMREVWKEAKRSADPDTAARIQLDRQHVEIARRGMGHIAGIAGRVIGWKAENTLRALIKSPFEPAQNGFDIFGFTPTQVAGMRHRIEQEQAAGR